MESAQREIESYIDDVNEYVSCLGREADDIRSEASNVQDDWSRAVRTYNNR